MFTKTVVALSLAASALAQFSVNSPTFVQCQPVLVSWTGSTSSPFTLAIIPGGMPSAAAIEFVSDSLGVSPYTWTVNLAAGTNITMKLTDSTGAIAYSAPGVIQQGASNSCLNASASTSGVATGAITSTNTAAASGTAVVGGGAGGSSGSMSAASGASGAMSGSMTSMASMGASSGAAAGGMTSSAASAAATTSAAASRAASAGTSLGSVLSSAAAAATSAATGAGYNSAVVGLPAVFAGLLGFAVLA